MGAADSLLQLYFLLSFLNHKPVLQFYVQDQTDINYAVFGCYTV
jgi:hypothetical protein